MSDDALTRKLETAAKFNGVAGGFDSEGTFAHFGQRPGLSPGAETL